MATIGEAVEGLKAMTVGKSTDKVNSKEDEEVYEDAIHIVEEDIVDTGYYKIQNLQFNPGAEFMRYRYFVAPHLCVSIVRKTPFFLNFYMLLIMSVRSDQFLKW